MTDSTAIARCCARLTERAKDPRLMVVKGLADDLRSIGEALSSIQSAQAVIAGAFITKHFGYQLDATTYGALRDIELATEEAPCPNATKP